MSETSPEAVRKRRAAWADRARFAGLVLIALAVGTVLPQLIGDDEPDTEGSRQGSAEAQEVAAWVLHAEGGRTYVAVFASGGKPSIALAIPAQVTINLPGQSLGTLADAAAAGDPGLVEVALENLLGAPVDDTLLAPISSVGEVVDGVGGLRVRERSLGGSEVVTYLSDVSSAGPVDQAFLRWQDVLEGLIQKAPGRPEALPEPLGHLLEEEPSSFREFPVIDIGGGLLRPDQDSVAALVDEHFIPAAADAVRLVVLNGVGTPGIGEEVARILVPEGFRLVSSGNANTFRLEVTQIIASSRRDLEAAERAQTLLGAGEVSLGNQPAGLADITVVVGRDFGGS
ncbi:MAG: LytR C-terminal domain-containing protein [Actinomycetota bacterium]